MMRIALPVSLAAAALLAACGSPGPDRTTAATPNISTQEYGYQPGTGVVVSASPVPAASAGGTATASATDPAAQRLAIRMENGRIQYVDVSGHDIPRAGERVQLTSDRQIVKQ